ncbi:hypothetical protein HMPREF9997_02076, partial [Corynebacterium durum F0235]
MGCTQHIFGVSTALTTKQKSRPRRKRETGIVVRPEGFEPPT